MLPDSFYPSLFTFLISELAVFRDMEIKKCDKKTQKERWEKQKFSFGLN
jgi:hypothetical protein